MSGLRKVRSIKRNTKSGGARCTQVLSPCPLRAVGSTGRCNTRLKSRSARVSKSKVSADHSSGCPATQLNWERAPPAAPQLLLGHRPESSKIYSTHRPPTPSLTSEIKCCVDPLRPPPKADIARLICSPRGEREQTERHGEASIVTCKFDKRTWRPVRRPNVVVSSVCSENVRAF